MKCPLCGKPADVMHRNKPKGEAAQFVCYDCLPEDMKLSKPDLAHTTRLANALKGGD